MPVPDLPRFRLFDGPSPFHRVPRFAEALGGRVDLWVKREDLLPIAFGGNKLRNLEFLVGAALAESADTLVTVGRRWSNHARLTAAAGAMAGLDVHLVLSGPPTAPPNPGVVLDRLFGATVHLTATSDRADREALLDRVTTELRAAGRRPYVVGVGGSGPVGSFGQVLAALEVAAQAAAAGVRPARIIVPTATGGTHAGLVVGCTLAGQGTSVIGVVVSPLELDGPSGLQAKVDAVAGLVGATVTDPLELDPSQLGAGYGRPTEDAAAATTLLARTEGILVDPIYTAKALAALIARVRAGALDGQAVVFWHAGGTPGLFEPLDP